MSNYFSLSKTFDVVICASEVTNLLFLTGCSVESPYVPLVFSCVYLRRKKKIPCMFVSI